MRVPGGKPGAIFVGIIGLTITTLTIILSLIPQPDEPNKPLAVLKVAGGCGALLLIGGWLYRAGSKKKAMNADSASVRYR
jgi:glutamate:GABA antiporter